MTLTLLCVFLGFFCIPISIPSRSQLISLILILVHHHGPSLPLFARVCKRIKRLQA